jgi:hypothetical protein
MQDPKSVQSEMGILKAVFNAFGTVPNPGGVEPAGSPYRGSGHPKLKPYGYAAKRKRLRKLQRQARKVTRQRG